MTPLTKLKTEEELLKEIAEGNEIAFATIFHRYKSSLYSFALKITKSAEAAEELVQECFVKLWSGRSNLREVDNATRYIHMIVKNASLDHLRKLALDSKIQQKFEQGQNVDNSALNNMDLSETRKMIRQALKLLSPHQRQVFEMSRFKGMSYNEIAETLNISPNTVRNHLVKSLKMIRNYLESHYNIIVSLFILATVLEVTF
ncbi:MAG TPA: RNA polymerase sigma-70 factor [Parasegetibacter sp.]